MKSVITGEVSTKSVWVHGKERDHNETEHKELGQVIHDESSSVLGVGDNEVTYKHKNAIPDSFSSLPPPVTESQSG